MTDTTETAPAEPERPAPPEPWLLALKCGHWNTDGNPEREVVYCEPCRTPQPVEHRFDLGHNCWEHMPW